MSNIAQLYNEGAESYDISIDMQEFTRMTRGLLLLVLPSISYNDRISIQRKR